MLRLTVLLCITAVSSLVGQSVAEPSPLRSTVFSPESGRVRTNSAGLKQRAIVDTLTATLAKLEMHETTLAPGQSPHPPHRHLHEEMMIVRTGAVEVRFGETVQTAGPGSVVFCASNELHGLRNIGSEPATYLVIRLDSPAVASATSPAAITASSARTLLNALPDSTRASARIPFDSSERLNWYFVPIDRQGLTIARMPAPARALVDTLLHTGLSDLGVAVAKGIMHHESILGALEASAPPGTPLRQRDSTKYYLSVFGTPHADSVWGWRFEGHHLSVNYTGVGADGQVVAPLFMGANPAKVPSGPSKGLRLLAAEEDLARELVLMLDADRRSQAIFSDTAFEEILTRNDPKARPLSREGLRAGDMSPAQQAQLRRLVEVYAGRMSRSARQHAMKDIDDGGGFGELRFGWAGATALGAAHYYRIHGPTVLVEYDNRQSNANHVHTVWRDLRHDFGGDMLSAHYAKHRHAMP